MAVGCEDKPGYLQNAEGGRDALMIQVAELLTVYIFIMHRDFSMCLCTTSQVFMANRGQQEAKLYVVAWL